MNQDLTYLKEAKRRFSGDLAPYIRVERGRTARERYALLLEWCEVLKDCRVEYNIDDDA